MLLSVEVICCYLIRCLQIAIFLLRISILLFLPSSTPRPPGMQNCTHRDRGSADLATDVELSITSSFNGSVQGFCP